MIWFLAFIGLVLVTAIAFFAVGSTVRTLERTALPAVLEVDDAVDWVAERLPEEAAAALTRDEVTQIIAWWLEFVAAAGLSTKHGQELGEEALEPTAGSTIADLDAGIDRVVAQALDQEEPLDEVAVVVVLDLLHTYLTEVGAIGGPAEEGE